MRDYTLTHLSNAALLRDLAALVTRDRLTTATLLAHIAEVDARRLHVPAGYPSMHAYCVDELRLSEDAASKRIQAARAARRFPAIFTELAEGRLHLAAVCLLAPHLTPENADMLIEAATHRRKSEIEEWLARRFQPPEALARMRAVPSVLSVPPVLSVPSVLSPPIPQHAPGHVECGTSASPGLLDEHAPGHVDGTQVQALSHNSERFFLQLTIARSTRDKLQYAQALLSHALPTGDVAQVLDRALDALILQLEKQKFGALTQKSGQSGRPGHPEGPGVPRAALRKRAVPACIRRAVWERDEGRCTFVSASGTRCKSRRLLEFDHVNPVARGGRATVDSMRLRCRAHNQYEAERTFGAAFMMRKRLEARLAVAEARIRAGDETRTPAAAKPVRMPAPVEPPMPASAEPRMRAEAQEQSQDVLAGLRNLGCKAGDARRAVEFSQTLHGATLEERMRVALQFLGRR